MSLTTCSVYTQVIEDLGDHPNTDDNLSADDLKKKFDKEATDIVDFLNDTLIAELNGGQKISAAKWTAAQSFTIQDADGTNTGAASSVDGSEAVALKLPSTIKASITGNASTADDLGENKVLSIAKGGTGATTAAAARQALSAASLTSGKVTPSEASATAVAITESETLSSSRAGRFMYCSSTSDITLTIPASGFDAYTEIEIYRRNTGDVIITPASGTTLMGVSGSSAYKIPDQYTACAIKHISDSEWLITGNIEAVSS